MEITKHTFNYFTFSNQMDLAERLILVFEHVYLGEQKQDFWNLMDSAAKNLCYLPCPLWHKPPGKVILVKEILILQSMSELR